MTTENRPPMGDKPNVQERRITDYQPDPANANRGNERGAAMIEDSFQNLGAGRSLVADKNGVLIAGNKSQQAALDAGIEKVIEVETDGNTVVVVRRIDLDLLADDESEAHRKARQLAYADNRTSEVNLTWDAAQIAADVEAGLDLSGFFHEDELVALMDTLAVPEAPDDFPSYDEDIDTEYCCPKCGYRWSGKPNAGGTGAAADDEDEADDDGDEIPF